MPQGTASFDDIATDQGGSSSGTASFDDIEPGSGAGPAKSVSPEVERAIASVPKPRVDYMETAFAPGSTEDTVGDFFPHREPVSPEAQAFERQRAHEWGQALSDQGTAILREEEAHPLETAGNLAFPGVGTAARGAKEVVTGPKRLVGAGRIASGVGEGVSTLLGPAALENPVPLATGLATGTGASAIAGKVAHGRVSPENEEAIKELAFWAPAVAGTLMGAHGGVEVSPEGTRASAGIRGGTGAGVAVTPEEVVLRGGVAGRTGELRIPRGGKAQPPTGPQLEAPTIEGQVAPTQPPPPQPQPTDLAAQAAASMSGKMADEARAARMVAGVPEPAPPVPPPAPQPEPIHEINPQHVDRVAGIIAQLPPELRPKAMIEAHGTLSRMLEQQQKIVGPDGRLEVIDSPKAASSVALRWINDAVKQADEQAAEAAKPPKEPKAPKVIDNEISQAAALPKSTGTASFDEIQQPVAVETKATPEAAQAESTAVGRKTVRDTFTKGDQVELADGTKGTITFTHPDQSIVRVKTEDGRSIAVGLSKVKAVPTEVIGEKTAKPRTPGEPLEHGFNTKPAEDLGQAVREGTEKSHGKLERRKVEGIPAPGQVGTMNVAELKLAPQRFQYKLGTDAEGVSSLLKEQKKFNPDLAGVISVWRDPQDGKFYVVNGHHRLELAKRTGQKSVAVRHITAEDAQEARAVGARQNIAEGRGTPVDAAKFFRDTGITSEHLQEHGISLGESTAKQGLALSHLDTPLFNKVVSGDIRLGRAVAIGEATSDPAEQKAILSLVEKRELRGQKIPDSVLSELIRFVKESGKEQETTADLFGSQQVTKSLALEKAEISDYIRQQLAKDRKLFGFVAKEGRAAELERGGNKIDAEKSKEISTGAQQAEEVYNRLSARGGEIADILDQAAQRLSQRNNPVSVKSEAYQRIREAVSKTLRGETGKVSEGLEAGAGRSETGKAATSKPQGPVSLFSPDKPAPPFYSKAARVAFEKVPNAAAGNSILATLRNNGVKEDEIKWLGLDDFLRDKFYVKKADLLSHIMRNLMQVSEVSKGQRTPEQQQAIDEAKDKFNNAYRSFQDLLQKDILDKWGTSREGIEQSWDEGKAQRRAQIIAQEVTTSGQSSAEILYAEYEHYAYGKKPSDELLRAGANLFNANQDVKASRKENQLPTKYESYTLPGSKENYTELLLTLPVKDTSTPVFSVKQSNNGHDWHVVNDLGGEVITAGTREYAQQRADEMNAQGLPAHLRGRDGRGFQSGHFDEPNILTHVRFDDRTDADGKKVLFVEEVQSDWHQKGKKQGYKGDLERALTPEEKELQVLNHKTWTAPPNQDPWTDAERARAQELQAKVGVSLADKARRLQSDIPDAPFKTDWHELAMKRMLRYAAEHGYERLGWVTGQQTADRYDLAKHLETIYYEKNESDGTYDVTAQTTNGRNVDVATHVTPDKLVDHIGKDITQRIVEGKGDNAGPGVRALRGVDLKVGGEWAKRLYDQAIPNFLNKVGKKWGAKVGETKIPTGVDQSSELRIAANNALRNFGPHHRQYLELLERANAAGETYKDTVHSIDITPEMAHSVVYEGQPLFQNDPYALIRDRAPEAWAHIASNATAKSVHESGLKPYVEMNSEGLQLVARAIRRPFLGASIPPKNVPEIFAGFDDIFKKIKKTSPEAAANLEQIKQAIKGAVDKDSGVTIAPKRDLFNSQHDLRILHEELFHAEVQHGPGRGVLARGVPAEMINDPGIRQMVMRIENETGRSEESLPEVIIAEAMADIVTGTPHELKPELAEKTATKYYEAVGEMHGVGTLEKAQAIQDLVDDKARALGLTKEGEGFHEEYNRPARTALANVLGKYRAKAGAGREATGAGGIERREVEGAAGSAEARNAPPHLLPRAREGSRETGSAGALAATEPIGLTDEELQAWAKSKNFHVEPAGEQGDLFGEGQKIFRVSRNRGGEYQTGLVYGTQLDHLSIPKENQQESLFGGESGSFSPSALNPLQVGKIYDRFINRVINQHLDLGDKYRRVADHDPVIAKMLHQKDNAPRYFRDKAKSNVDQATKGLSEHQVRLASMMVDSDAREYLEANHPEQFKEAEDDPAVTAAVEKFARYQQELTALRMNLGWHVRRDLTVFEREEEDVAKGENPWLVLDREGQPVADFRTVKQAQHFVEEKGKVLDHLKRTYPEHLREPLMGRTDAGPNSTPGSYGGIRPPKPDKKQRLATGEYFYNHGAKDFTGYLQSYAQASHATLNKKIYDDLTTRATAWKDGTAQPTQITYRGKAYYRPDVATSMRAGIGENRVKNPLEYRAYDPAKDDKLLLKSFEDGWGTLITGKPGIGIHDRWLAPKEVVEALDNYDKTRGQVESDSIRRFFQEQIVGLFGPSVHMLNIMRRLAQTVGTGAWDPRVWPYYQRLFFSKELRERMASGLQDEAIDALSKHGTYTNARDIGSLHSYFLGNLNPGNWVRQTIGKFSKGLLFDPKFMGGFGGMDQKARVLAYDFLREHAGMDEEEAAKNVDDGFGNYNRASWTERMKRWAKVLLFPGWDFSSLKWFLRHPIKTAVAPALITMAANVALNKAGKNKDQDKYDYGYLHYGDRKFRTSLVTESMAMHIAEPLLEAGRSALEGGDKRDIGRVAGEGLIRGAGGLAGSLRPDILTAAELLSNRQYIGGNKEIYKAEDANLPGLVLPNRKLDKLAAFAVVKAFPAINRFLDSSYDQVDVATGIGSVVGVTNYKSGAEERLKANVARAMGYSETLSALAERQPDQAEQLATDPSKAAYLMFKGDLDELAKNLRDIDQQRERVSFAPDMGKDERSEALKDLRSARDQILSSADSINDALTDVKLRMKAGRQP